VDSLTHALTAAFLAYTLHLPQVLPFFVLGAVIIDGDVLFSRLSDRHPSLYLFTHGGCAHSIAGALVLSVIAWTTGAFVLAAGLVHPVLSVPAGGPVAFAAVLAGALLHIGLDTLAVPGLPLFVPFSDRKYTAGLLPGPSILLMASSLFFLIWIGLGMIDLASMVLPYATIIAAFLAIRLVAFFIARTALRGKGRPVPMINPLRWLVISEIPDVWTVGEYRIGKGMGNTEYMMKYRSTSAKETGPFLALPEVRRLLFHSYIVTAEKKGTMLIFSDPLRISGRIFYPPHHMCVCVPLPDPSSLSGHSSNSLKSNPE
jgi:inner membrane protein